MTSKTFLFLPTEEENNEIIEATHRVIDALAPLKSVEKKAFALAVLCQEFEDMTGIDVMQVKTL